MTFPKWYERGGIKKLFSEAPKEIGWEECAGHYDFALGVWIGDAPAKKEPKQPGDGELKALRVEYAAKAGKKPFGGWKEGVLREKIAALSNG